MNQINRYQIKDVLGGGGMALVYRAYDPHFKREVAIKVMAAHLLHDPQFRQRSSREAQVIASRMVVVDCRSKQLRRSSVLCGKQVLITIHLPPYKSSESRNNSITLTRSHSLSLTQQQTKWCSSHL